MSTDLQENDQLQFNRTYISSAELITELGISKPALTYLRKNDRFPNAIVANSGKSVFWVREKILPYIEAWKIKTRNPT